jgi:hypothetical protein
MSTKPSRAIVFASITILAAALPLLSWSADDRQKADDHARPFYPSLINTSTGKPVTSSEFMSPDICGGCHAEIFAQWKGSMHSHAFHDPIFQALWKIGSQETKGFTDKLCAGCHTGIGTVSEEIILQDGEFQVSTIAKRGVQCDLCHTVIKSTFLETPTHEPQNASIVLAPGEIKRGPYQDSVSPFHKTAYSELHTKSEFCANCHNVFHPVTNFHIERTYDEWKFSVYAQNGIQCQDCHMMPLQQSIETARTLKKQNNPGKACSDSPQHAEIARERLKSAAELALTLPAAVEPGAIATVSVKVINVGAGHNLPTSLTEVRQMWLELKVTDTTGTTLYHSGTVDDKGTIDPEAKLFHAKAVDEQGKHTYKPWEINAITTRYTFLVPKTVNGPLSVKATLRYRSYPQSLANLLLGKDAITLPIVDMVQKETEVMVKK